jgi:cytochrome P450
LNREILRECLMGEAAGMVTTREFIVMACWYLLEREDLRGAEVRID